MFPFFWYKNQNKLILDLKCGAVSLCFEPQKRGKLISRSEFRKEED